jgi:mono/diheme cytochrome c family protein
MDLKPLLLAACVVATIGSCGNSNSNAEAIAAADAFDPIRTYNQKCGVCHGRDGKMMASGAPDLTASKISKDEIIAIVTYGKNTMPPQKDVLTPEQISAVADHVLTLRNP